MDEVKHYEEMYGYGPRPAPSEKGEACTHPNAISCDRSSPVGISGTSYCPDCKCIIATADIGKPAFAQPAPSEEDLVSKLAGIAYEAHMRTPEGYRQMMDEMRAALRSRLSSPTPASAEIPPEAWGRLAEDVDELRHPERHTASESAEELADDLCAMIGIKREGSTSIEMRKRLAAHDAKTKREAADRAWPLLKQEYEWRKEDSECGGDEVSEGLDMLRARLDTAILGEGKA